MRLALYHQAPHERRATTIGVQQAGSSSGRTKHRLHHSIGNATEPDLPVDHPGTVYYRLTTLWQCCCGSFACSLGVADGVTVKRELKDIQRALHRGNVIGTVLKKTSRAL